MWLGLTRMSLLLQIFITLLPGIFVFLFYELFAKGPAVFPKQFWLVMPGNCEITQIFFHFKLVLVTLFWHALVKAKHWVWGIGQMGDSYDDCVNTILH